MLFSMSCYGLFETVRVKNPGSKIILRRQEGSDPPLFKRLYYSLSAMKLGFLEGCRPIIGLDGCFLKIVYQGQLLVAVGRDDRQKGLVDALRRLAPGSEHRFYVRQLYENFKAKFKGEELKEYLWKAATTTNKQEFRAYMKKIAELDPKKSRDYETAAKWLSKILAEGRGLSFL
ncbi:UNVERIFIED_CONTAM: hypothetical protein Slati_2259300 [Sesamum latifolium]|uniref:Uncharacterized protein n=1 Tax=Sesamum latifolium TaxID=2727402 RepID=A0AAW2WX56_9LAMI